MKEFDLKSDLPTISVAVARLKNYIRITKSSEKIIKVIHGYGSHGVGGGIRAAVRSELDAMRTSRQIKTYIPGEALGVPMGFDEDIRQYKILLQNDPDYRKANDGITYIVF